MNIVASLPLEISPEQKNITTELTTEQQATLASYVDPDAVKETKFEWNLDFQREILSLILNDLEFVEDVRPLVRPSYFESDIHTAICKAAFAHFDQYHTLPNLAQLTEVIRKVVARKNKPEITIKWLGEMNTVFSYYVPGLQHRQFYFDVVKKVGFHAEAHRAIKEVQEEAKANGAMVDWVKVATKIISLNEASQTKGSQDAYTIEELSKLPPIQWHIEKMYPVGGFVCIYGPFGSGKSFTGLDMALCHATGKPYLGMHAVKQGAVAYIAAEGHQGTYKRIKAWLKAHNMEAPSNFIVIPKTFDLVGDDTAPAAIAAIAKAKLGMYPAAIFIDTLARMFGSGNENDTPDMNKYVANVAALGTQCKASTITVHHSGKDFAKGARGAVALGAACDSMIEISGSPEGEVSVRCVKQKDAAPFKPFVLKATPIEIEGDSEGSIVLNFAGTKSDEDAKAKVQSHDDEEYQVAILLPELDGVDVVAENAFTQTQLMEKLEWNQPKISRVLARMTEKNTAQKRPDKNPKKPALWYREKLLTSLS